MMELSSLVCTYLKDSDQGPFSCYFDPFLMGTFYLWVGLSCELPQILTILALGGKKTNNKQKIPKHCYFHLKDEKKKDKDVS